MNIIIDYKLRWFAPDIPNKMRRKKKFFFGIIFLIKLAFSHCAELLEETQKYCNYPPTIFLITKKLCSTVRRLRGMVQRSTTYSCDNLSCFPTAVRQEPFRLFPNISSRRKLDWVDTRSFTRTGRYLVTKWKISKSFKDALVLVDSH